jgi:hypothetical protein
VVVEVVLEPVERHSGDDREDSVLKREPRRRKVGRTWEGCQTRDRRWPCPQEARSVLERLDSPALDAAGECGRESHRAFVSGLRRLARRLRQ